MNTKVENSFQVFDADHNGELDFAEFVKVGISKYIFCESGNTKTKICKGLGDVHNEECGEREKTSIPFRHLRHRRRWTHLQQRAVQGGRMSTALPSQYLYIG